MEQSTNPILKLSDIVPRPSFFQLAATGDFEYQLRPFDLDDEAWLATTYPNLQDILTTMQMKHVAAIAWHQLDAPSREKFVKQKVEIVNDEGDKVVIEMGGLKLFSTMIRGVNEKVTIYKALMEAIGVSRPVLDEIKVDDMAGVEKKSPQ